MPFCRQRGNKTVYLLCRLEAEAAGKTGQELEDAKWFDETPEEHLHRLHPDEAAAVARVAGLEEALYPGRRAWILEWAKEKPSRLDWAMLTPEERAKLKPDADS